MIMAERQRRDIFRPPIFLLLRDGYPVLSDVRFLLVPRWGAPGFQWCGLAAAERVNREGALKWGKERKWMKGKMQLY